MIFGNWRPGGLAAGAGLFGYSDAMQLRSSEAVHALLLAGALASLAFAAWQLRRGHARSGAILAGVSVGLGMWYFGTDSLPPQLVVATPYITTLVVLALASQRLRMPAADGQPYRRGEGR